MAIGNLQILLDFSRVANLVVDEVCEQRLSTRIILRYVDQLKASHGDKWLKPCGSGNSRMRLESGREMGVFCKAFLLIGDLRKKPSRRSGSSCRLAVGDIFEHVQEKAVKPCWLSMVICDDA